MPVPLPSVLALLTLLLINQGAPSEVPTPAGIAAKAWAIFDGKTGKPLWGFHDGEARPIASTTKIMTAWIILQRADKDPKLLDEEIRFSERAAATRGSSCRLKVGERLRVSELLYGLLLPSGNDAAVALAEHFGPRLQSGASAKEDSVRLFVAEMNRQAKSLKLGATSFLDPNGLARNQASARDLAVLTWHAMHNRRFRDYVKTRSHECEVLGEGDTKRRVTWKNTNRLLEDAGCDGVKTGTTNAAGACLVASEHRGADHLIVVVLGSTNGDGRYEDARKLFHWAWEQRAGKREKLKENRALAPWGTNSHPTDGPKRHVEKIAMGRHVYVVHQGGTMDGANCRSPLGVGMMEGPAIEQTWESNRAIRLENTGETDVINPWLANGRNGFRTLDEIVASAVKPGMTDREKAYALRFQEICHLQYLRDARRDGAVRWIGITSHQRTLAAKMAKSGLLDTVMIRYNAAHCCAERDVFPATEPLGLPVIAYTALRWGALLRPTAEDPAGFAVPRPPAWYRFVLQRPAVAVTLAAPQTRAELDEDLHALAADGPLTSEEYAALAEHGERVRRHAGGFR